MLKHTESYIYLSNTHSCFCGKHRSSLITDQCRH